jgi:ureidoglycolate dehydrogenase (NAD+)
MTTQNETLVSETDLRALCLKMMELAKLDSKGARATADELVTTDMWGVHTHGTRQLPKLLENFETGKMDLNATASVIDEGPTWASIDGKRAMAFQTAIDGMEMAINKARDAGTATVTARNIGHFGAAGYFAVMAAEAGMIGIAMCNVDPCIAVPGTKGPVLGTNPFAYGIPTSGRPVFFDIATSAVAATKVFRAKARGETIPDGWLVDKDGVPTNDPSHYPEEGALLPFAAHKGYGFAFLIEALCAGLSGGPTPDKVNCWVSSTPEPVNQSFTFIAINPDTFAAGRNFLNYMDGLTAHVQSADKAVNADHIYLPGEIEWRKYQIAQQQGIALPADVADVLRSAAAKYGVDFPV